MAIAETLAEHFPHLWPADSKARSIARAACAEMHSMFSALRAEMPMDIRKREAGKVHSVFSFL